MRISVREMSAKVIPFPLTQTKDVAETPEERAKRLRSDEEKRLEAVRKSHWTGDRYQKGRPIKDVAKDLRADIKAAQKDGRLPATLDVVVRCRAGRGLNRDDISVTIKYAPFAVFSPEWIADRLKGGSEAVLRYSVPMRALITTLEGMINRYGYDRSDTMTDYFDCAFWSSVTVDSDLEKRARRSNGLTY
jgi:hypothetical protein